MTEEVDIVGTRVGNEVCRSEGDGEMLVVREDVPDGGLVVCGVVAIESVGKETVVKRVCGLLGVVEELCAPGVPVPPLVLGVMVETDVDVDFWWDVWDTMEVEIMAVLNEL